MIIKFKRALTLTGFGAGRQSTDVRPGDRMEVDRVMPSGGGLCHLFLPSLLIWEDVPEDAFDVEGFAP